jgi:hypothetical protein
MYSLLYTGNQEKKDKKIMWRKKKEYSSLDKRRSCGRRRKSVRLCIIENM